jgi:hypothetical protein
MVMGNAPLADDCRELVELADVVVRLNHWQAASARGGSRTSTFCVNTLGLGAIVALLT